MNSRVDGSSNAPCPIPGSRRSKPGRPKTGDNGIFASSLLPKPGDTAVTVVPNRLYCSNQSDGTAVVQTVVPVTPRLLNLGGAAAYLSVSTWKIREMEAAGVISRVRIPLGGTVELRKLLFDRLELDELVNSWKDRA